MKTTTNTLQELVLRETDDGVRPIRFLLEVMDADIESVKIADRFAAARELLDRCFGKPFTAPHDSSETPGDAYDASGDLLDRILRGIDEVPDADGEPADD